MLPCSTLVTAPTPDVISKSYTYMPSSIADVVLLVIVIVILPALASLIVHVNVPATVPES